MSITPQKSFVPKQSGNGVSGTFDNPAAITVKDGLITSITSGAAADPFSGGGSSGGSGGTGITVAGSVNSYSGITVLRFLAGLITNPASGEADFQFPPASGDVSGTYPALTVIALQGVSWQSGTPSDAQIPLYNTGNARWEHHGVSQDASVTDAGVWTTTGLQGVPIAVASPSSGQVLEFVSGAWTPTNRDPRAYFGVATVTAITAISLVGNPTVGGTGTNVGSIINAVNQAGTGSPPYAAHVDNGPWQVMGTGSTPMQRPFWYATGAVVSYGAQVFTSQGTAITGQLQTSWELTSSGAVVGTDPTSWIQVLVSLQGGVNGVLPVVNGGQGNATLTAHGPLIGEGTSPVASMSAGSAGQVVRSGGASADPTWSTATYPATAGTSGNILASDGTNIISQALATSQIPDTTNYRYIKFNYTNGGSVLATGLANDNAVLDGGATLVAVYLTSPDSTSGSATVDIIRANAAVPTSSNSIVGGGGTKPALSSATYVKDTTFTSWTSTTFSADDVISVNLTAVTSLKYLSVVLVVKVT